MRRFLVCSGVAALEVALQRLPIYVQERRPDAVLFAGGVLNALPPPHSAAALHDRHRDALQALDRFFQVIGALGVTTALIPGHTDAPLQTFLHRGMHAETETQGLNLVHGSLADTDQATISGIGGELTAAEDSGDHVIRCSRTVARYQLRSFQRATHEPKILLLATAPPGTLGGPDGNAIVAEFIDTFHPTLCAVGGVTARRGSERVAKTLIVNPGRLADGSAAWVDLNEHPDQQVEFLDV